MTDIAQATPSAVDLNLGKSSADPKAVDKKVKPERPNEEEYKKELASAEKLHKTNMDALVCIALTLFVEETNT